MLTVEHVGARRRGDELTLRGPTRGELLRAKELSALLLGAASAAVGRTRESLEERLADVPYEPSDARLAGALAKLVLDGCEFQSSSPAQCAAARANVFAAAAAARREGAFDRRAVLLQCATEAGTTPELLEQQLGADTPRRDVLLAAPAHSAETLVRRWQLARIQAILLRAREVRCTLPASSPAALRALFRALKFRKLLFTLQEASEGLTLRITGPTNMFQASTRYGLELALSLHALAKLKAQVEADVLWGTERRVLCFKADLDPSWVSDIDAAATDPRLDKLCADLKKEGLEAEHNTAVLHIPGVGSVVPDLRVNVDGTPMYLELLGYWSRETVFKRLDWSMHHTGTPILFCAQERLRVSEEVMNDAPRAALYVYKESLRAKVVAQMLRTRLG